MSIKQIVLLFTLVIIFIGCADDDENQSVLNLIQEQNTQITELESLIRIQQENTAIDDSEQKRIITNLTTQIKEVQGSLVADDKQSAKLISLLEDQTQRIDSLAEQIKLHQDNQQVEEKKALTPEELKKLIQGGWIFDVISQGENIRNQWRFDGDSFTHMLCLYKCAEVVCALDIGTFSVLPNLTDSGTYTIKLHITTKGTADASNPGKLTVLSADETNEQKTVQVGFEGKILVINNIPMQPLPNQPTE